MLSEERSMLDLVARQIADNERNAETLKVEIRERQDRLLTTEAKLMALRAFRDAWPTLELPSPVPMAPLPGRGPLDSGALAALSASVITGTAPTPPVPLVEQIAAVIDTEMKPVAPATPKLTPREFVEANSVAADVVQVEAWAAQRGIQFKGWEDLSRVNLKRKELKLQPFARRYVGR